MRRGTKNAIPISSYLLELKDKSKQIASALKKVLKDKSDMSMRDAWLLSLSFPDEEFAPKYKCSTADEIAGIEANAWSSLNHPRSL